MITVEAVDGARKEEVEKALKERFFSDVTGIVEFVSRVVNEKWRVCFKSDRVEGGGGTRSSIAQLVRACGC